MLSELILNTGYFVASINDSNSATTGLAVTHYVDLSAENRFLIRDKRRITAVSSDYGNGAATYLVISGYGDIVVSEGLTAAVNVWSQQKQTSLFLVRGSIDLIVQIPPHVEVVRHPYQFADIVKSLIMMGKKTFADGAREMVKISIDASTSDWS